MIDYYDSGGYYDNGGQKNPGLDGMLRPLHPPTEKQDLLAFLASLGGRIREGR